MVSGYFFASSMKLGWWDFLRKKALTLLLPCFVWGILEAVLRFDSWSQLAADILLPTYWPFWFFKGLFLVQVYMCVLLKFTARMEEKQAVRVCLLILLSLLVYAMPYMAVPRVMLPIFWVGYVLKIKYDLFVKYHRIIGIVACALFVGIYYFWNAETMHYSASASVTIYHVLLGKHGYTWMNLVILGYRILLGAAGSVAIIAAMHELNTVNQSICVVGVSTAGVYVLQTYILEKGMGWIFSQYADLNRWPLALNYLIMIGISIVMLFFITWLYQQLHKWAIIDFLLFGSGCKNLKNLPN